MPYSVIVIIYNPNSTGPSEQLAKDLKQRIRRQLPKQTIKLHATKRAGHAEKIAYNAASSSKNPLIISSSGDGGYHEVVNGAMKAQREGAQPTVGLLPGGNANDHYANLHKKDIVDLILKEKNSAIDLLRLSATVKGKAFDRYAHSYIGLGVTPWVGKELTKANLNRFNEIIIVLRALLRVRSIKLRVHGDTRSYSSIIFSNVDIMAKMLRISRPSKINDGKFEVTIFEKTSKLKILALFLKASTTGVHENLRARQFAFATVRKTLIQCDGEVFMIDAKTDATIAAEKRVLRCIV